MGDGRGGAVGWGVEWRRVAGRGGWRGGDGAGTGGWAVMGSGGEWGGGVGDPQCSTETVKCAPCKQDPRVMVATHANSSIIMISSG